MQPAPSVADVQRTRDVLRAALARWFEQPLAAAFAAIGVGPNTATLIGVAVAGGAAYFAATGSFLLAGILVFVAAAFDLIDGALARRAGLVSRRGALLDSVFDRISEGAVLIGLLVYFTAPDTSSRTDAILVFVAFAGSIMISYVRARAEGLGLRGKTGWLTRPERVAIMGIGLIVDQPSIALWMLAVGAPLSAAQRFWAVWRSAGDDVA